jgi:hypothetical protein
MRVAQRAFQPQAAFAQGREVRPARRSWGTLDKAVDR